MMQPYNLNEKASISENERKSNLFGNKKKVGTSEKDTRFSVWLYSNYMELGQGKHFIVMSYLSLKHQMEHDICG